MQPRADGDASALDALGRAPPCNTSAPPAARPGDAWAFDAMSSAPPTAGPGECHRLGELHDPQPAFSLATVQSVPVLDANNTMPPAAPAGAADSMSCAPGRAPPRRPWHRRRPARSLPLLAAHRGPGEYRRSRYPRPRTPSRPPVAGRGGRRGARCRHIASPTTSAGECRRLDELRPAVRRRDDFGLEGVQRARCRRPRTGRRAGRWAPVAATMGCMAQRSMSETWTARRRSRGRRRASSPDRHHRRTAAPRTPYLCGEAEAPALDAATSHRSPRAEVTAAASGTC